MSISTRDIRNLALLGASGAGKTLLAEALLCEAGALAQPGSIERGDTLLDFSRQEKAHGHSLDTAIASFEALGHRIHLIDTPGYPDLLGRACAVLPAVETVAVVIDARKGIDTVTRRAMDAAHRHGRDRLLVINHIDAADDLAALLGQVQEAFGAGCLPVNLPAESGTAVVDCFFAGSGPPTDFSSVEQAHEQIIDQVVELDEDLMELYLEQGDELTPQQLHEPFEQALRDEHLTPVCFTSARSGAGVPELLRVIVELLPHPGEGNPPHFVDGEGPDAEPVTVAPDPQRHFLGHVFKTVIDPFAGRLSLFRVHQGCVRKDTPAFIGEARKPLRIAHLYRVHGAQQIEIDQGVPGDICAIAKVDDIRHGDVLHDSHDEDHIHLRPAPLPEPMYGLAIAAARRGDEQKLAEGLATLAAEDPSLRLEHHAQQGETVLRTQGELHMRVLLEQLAERYGLQVETRPPRIAYRETVAASAEGHYRHKKQSGGAGQFGEVHLRVEPLPRGAGFEFVDAVVGGAIPRQFIPAVEKGVRQALDEGAIAGYPLQDLRVTVHDGKHHPVDSKEIAFVTAGRRAFVEAVRAARPQVLEPLVDIEVSVPAACVGDASGDLAGRRGRITRSTIASDGSTLIEAQVPLGELETYPIQLRAMTAGLGSYSIAFSHYEPVPAPLQESLVTAFRPQEEVA